MSKSAATQSEKRQFKVHPHIIYDLIERQSGSIQKAILEAVMNSIDAQATKVEITLGSGKVTVTDNGKGFVDRHAIEHFFEVFGQPHDASEGKTYGEFRMGRGQIFSKGKNHWKSGNFEMHVDFKKNGLDYDLHEMEESYPGCMVDVVLYDTLTAGDLVSVQNEVTKYVKYSSAEVILNGTSISTHPKDVKWKMETPEAYISVSPSEASGVMFYNLGVFTCELPAYKYGLSGTVVSKEIVKVNFARNEVLDSCPVFKKIKASVSDLSVKLAKTKKLTDSQRAATAQRLLAGEEDWRDHRTSRLFEDCTGKKWSLKMIWNWGMENNNKVIWTMAPYGSPSGGRLLQQGAAVVLNKAIMQTFGYTGSESRFLETVLKLDPDNSNAWMKYEWHPLNDLADKFLGEYEILNVKVLGKKQKAKFQALEKINRTMSYHYTNCEMRRLLIGRGSGGAEAWTDGKSFIALDKDKFELVKDSESGFAYLILLLVHEYCHGEDTTQSNVHDEEFYRVFHDTAFTVFGREHSRYAFQDYIQKMRVLNRTLNRKLQLQLASVSEKEELSSKVDTLIEGLKK